MVEKSVVVFFGRLKKDCDVVVTEHKEYEWIFYDPPHSFRAPTIDGVLAEVALKVKFDS